MKYLILVLVSLSSFANSLPESEVIKAIALEPNAGSKLCADLPQEPCYSYEGIDWHSAKLIDNQVLDFIRKDNESACLDEADCQLKLEALVCQFGQPIKNLESMSVYCALEVFKVDGKILVNDPVKKAAREEAERLAKDAAKAKEEKCKNFSFKGTTIAQLKQELNESLECRK